MILSVLIFNTSGIPRLSKFYTSTPPAQQRQLIAQIFQLVSGRPAGLCSFLDAPELRSGFFGGGGGGKGKGRETGSALDDDDDVRVIYRSVNPFCIYFEGNQCSQVREKTLMDTLVLEWTRSEEMGRDK